MDRCCLCNEPIEDFEFELETIRVVDGEYWHTECYAEYHEESLEAV